MVHKIKTQVFLKIFSVFLFVLLLGAYASTFALFDGNPYAPGSTLDPECAPTDTNCKVLLTSGGSSPWLTGTSNIYHNGNVNVGSSTGTINSSISGSNNIITASIHTFNLNDYDVLDTFPAIAINNDGNPVIVYYKHSQYSDMNGVLNIITCLDSECNNSTSNVIDNDSGFFVVSGFKISLKIDSNNIPHIAYMGQSSDYDGYNIRYASCIDAECSSVSKEEVVNENNTFDHSLSLDSNNNPYIIYNSSDSDSGNSTVSIARYVGGGQENTCSYYTYNGNYLINPDWRCSTVAFDANKNIYLSSGGVGDYMYIASDGFPRFVAESYDYNTSNTYITYNQCNNIDCTNSTSTIIDTNGGGNSSSLSVNSDGIPYIAYIVRPQSQPIPFNNKSSLFNQIGLIKKAEASSSEASSVFIAYLDEGNGSGCSETSDWTCMQIVDGYDTSSNDGYYYLDLEIGSDDIPKVVATKYLNDSTFSLDYIKCTDEICSSSTTSTVFAQGVNISNAYYLSSQIALDENNQSYFAYLDANAYELKFTKIGQSPSVSFGSGSSNLYTGGDLGITDNLFVDGKTVLGGGLYLSDNVLDNTDNALYNDGGDLYWNGEPVISNTEVTVGPALALGTAGSVSGSLSIASQYGGATTLQTYNDYNGGNYGSPTIYLPSSSGTLVTENGSVNYANSAGSASSASTLSSILGASLGGTGRNTLTANSLLVGNGTTAVNLIAPGTSGNVLTSNGTSWVSSPLSVSSFSSDIYSNTKVGTSAGLNLVSGAQYNTFIGYEAGRSASSGGTYEADNNMAIGYQSFYSNTTGYDNTASGFYSLRSNTTGRFNAAYGNSSLYSNTTGSYNSAFGRSSLRSNTIGGNNTAIGDGSLYYNNTGNSNTSSGANSLYYNSTGFYNSAYGTYSLNNNTTGNNNTASGYYSLFNNITGIKNTGQGSYSLNNIGKTVTAGSFIVGVSYTIQGQGTTDFTLIGAANNNAGTVFTATGVGSGTGVASPNSNYNTAIGYQSGNYITGGSIGNISSSNSLYIGTDTKALADGDTNEIVIGYNTTGNGSNTTTIGTGNVLYVGGSSISGKVARFTNSAGYCDINPLTTALVCSSDITLKKNITTLEKQTDLTLNKENIDFVLNQNIEIPDTILGKINLLTPVKYNWNTEEDTLSKHIGFIAQEVEQIFPDLVFTDKDTGLKSIAYSNLIPYTIKAIQEMDLKVKDLSSLDTESATSLGSLLRSFLEDASNGIEIIFSGEVRTKKLCLDDLCIDKSQLQKMLEMAGTSGLERDLGQIIIPPSNLIYSSGEQGSSYSSGSVE